MKKILIIFSFLLFGIGAKAQDFNKAKMDSLFSLIGENDKAMGSFSIFQDGKEVYQKSIGFADISQNISASNKTKYRIGSVSKSFTAVLFLQLVEENKVNLTSTLDKFYPEIPNASDITMEFLLNHHSGLFNYTNQQAYLEYMQDPKSKEEMLAIFKKNGTSFNPGERFEYSNTNYALLTFIIEDITKKDFSEVLQERIVKPLDLKNTYFGAKINSDKNEAFSYKRRKNWLSETETDMSVSLGAGGLVSTPTDLNIFFSALFNGKLLKAETFEKMIDVKDKYGYGIMKIPFEDKLVYGHGGGIDGFASMAYYFPEEKVAYSFSLNGLSMNSTELLKAPLKIYFGEEYELPVFKKEYEPVLSDLKSYEGTYSTPMLPIKLKIFIEDGVLLAQGTNQPSFMLNPVEKNQFKYDPAKLNIEFKPSENKLILSQGGGVFELTKEKEEVAAE